MTQVVLGIDPGERTGVAVVRIGSTAPFDVPLALTMRADDFPRWLRHFLQTSAVDGIAVEDWLRYGGPRGAMGASQAAYATGVAWGTVRALWAGPAVLVTRPAVLSVLGLKANARKTQGVAAARRLALFPLEASDHAVDAGACAIAGAGQFKAVA